MRRIPRTAFCAAVWLAAAAPVPAATPPSGFQDHQLTTVTEPTAIAYEPGSGNLFILEKGDTSTSTARVRRRAPSGGTVSTALTVTSLDANGERGLLGIAFDPDYLQGTASRWVYLYYTHAGASGSQNRVSRFKESGGVLSGEVLLLEGPILGATNHNGGTLRFLEDKTLLISMGDNDTDADALPKSRDMTDLRGKMLRINRDGTVPSDNPFVGQAGTRPEIWAWGLRNPFRFSIDASTGRPWIADVGENKWEEIDYGIPGADYGYPCYEGFDTFRSCSAPNAVFPALVYGHPGQGTPYTGYAIVGGPVYRGGNFPASYEGRLFFGDYGDGWIRSAAVSGSTLSDVQLFMSDALAPVDFAQAPNGCLAWVEISSGGVHETCYTAAANNAPIARASATPLSGPAPLAVQFTGSTSSDADGDTLHYAWTFGDGATSTAADPSHTYTAPGSYSATLTVDDGKGAANSQATSQPIVIVAGNSPPQPVITQPANGTHYDAGEVISYAGSATDPEDGAVPASGLSWTIVFHHLDHTHPFAGPIPGVASGTFTIPTDGEDSTQVWFRIHLTATDSHGLSATTFVDVVPNVTTITLATAPAGLGLQLSYGGTNVTAPASFASVVGFPRNIAAPSPQTIGGKTWTFDRWNDATDNARTIATPATNQTFEAVFVCTAGCGSTVDMDGDGWSPAAGDCDDNDPTVYPGAPELCDGKDNDCNQVVDDAVCSAFAGGDGTVNGIDLALLGRYFGVCSIAPSTQPWASVDLDKNGCLDGADLAVMAAVWGCSDSTPICR